MAKKSNQSLQQSPEKHKFQLNSEDFPMLQSTASARGRARDKKKPANTVNALNQTMNKPSAVANGADGITSGGGIIGRLSGIADGPTEIMSAPNGIMSESTKIMSGPGGITSEPGGTVGWPSGIADTPNGIIGESNRIAGRPIETTSWPRRIVGSPNEIVGMPDGIMNGPDATADSPSGIVGGPGTSGQVNRWPSRIVNGPDGVTSGPSGPVGWPSGIANGSNGIVDEPSGIMSLPNGIVGGLDGTIGGPSGMTSEPKRIIGEPNGTIDGLNGIVSGPSEIMSRLDGTVGRLGGIMNAPGGTMDGSSGIMISTAGTSFMQARIVFFFESFQPEPELSIPIYPDDTAKNASPFIMTGQFGMLGFLSAYQGMQVNPELATLTIGDDLTNMGLGMNNELIVPDPNGFGRREILINYGGPWADNPINATHIETRTPDLYRTSLWFGNKVARIKFPLLREDTLLYIFYNYPGEEYQIAAAYELYRRNWRYHKVKRIWLRRFDYKSAIQQTAIYEKGKYHTFDPVRWRKLTTEMVLQYEDLDEKPALPQAMKIYFNSQVMPISPSS